MQPTPIHTTNGDLLRAWWLARALATRRRWRIFLLLASAIWLSGAVYAPRVVAGLARLDGATRWLMALSLGGFGWLWGGLKQLGLITESTDAPHLLWIPLALALPTAVYGLTVLLSREPNPTVRLQRQLADLDATQGRPATADALAQTHAVDAGVPFVEVLDRQGQPVAATALLRQRHFGIAGMIAWAKSVGGHLIIESANNLAEIKLKIPIDPT